MDITAQDLKKYKQYVAANAKRKDMGIASIPSEIVKIDQRLGNPKFKDKHKRYRERKAFLSSVLKVEAQ